MKELEMSSEEIVQMYRGAKSKKTQIKIIAQLNDTTPARIKRILIEKGEIKDVEKQKTKVEIPTAVFKACKERIEGLNSEIEIARKEIRKYQQEIVELNDTINKIQSEIQEIVAFIHA
jgi:predicted  nucleic acid-binding Zn-ribbon protein